MKKVLIVGTSNTAGSCQSQESFDHYWSIKKAKRHFTEQDYAITNKDWLAENQRWYQGLLDKYEVSLLASPGATPQQQYWVVMNYIEQNPDVKFDAAILEGRQPVCASQPPWFEDGQVDTPENRLSLWVTPYPQANQIQPQNQYMPIKHCREDNAHWPNWYADYLTNELSLAETMASNWAICAALESFCEKVKFVSFTKNSFIEDDQKFLQNEFYNEYGISELWEGFEHIVDRNKYLCSCGHWNKQGCKIISDYAVPILEKELSLI